MKKISTIGRLAAALAMFAAVTVCALASVAHEESSVLVKKPAAAPISGPSLQPPTTNDAETLPAPSNPTVENNATTESVPAKPFLRPTPRRIPASTALAVKEEPMPAPEVPGVLDAPGAVLDPESQTAFEVHPAPPIEYDTDHDARKMYRKSGEVQVMMIACNPADGCYYQIPMCIPGCCAGEEPKVTGGRGLLGRGVVEFCWECGFIATVKFRHIRGDVRVDYEGD